MTLQVNIVFGGPSAEHEVSLKTAQGVIANLDRSKYNLRAVFVDKDKSFYYKDLTDQCFNLEDISNTKNYNGPFTLSNSQPIWNGCSVVFLALHGSFGEDGTIQGALDTMNIPYTGSGIKSSAIAMDKIISKFIYIQNGLSVPPYSIYGRNYSIETLEKIAAKHSFPLFIKAPQSGSSRLMARVESLESLRRIALELTIFSPDILIETTIKGIEFSCGVLEEADGSLCALPPIEIRPKSVYFDYNAKYSDGASEEIVPAPYPEELLDRIKEVAITAHKILGCNGVSRTDMIYSDDKLYVLETNTLPGLTKNSLLPKAFKATGGNYPMLLDKLIQSALSKKPTGVL